MGSTAEGGPPALFDWFFEAAYPASLQEDPPILRQFPPDFQDQESMQMVPKFCFPFDVERETPSTAVQHFTFVLTDLTGTRRFGFCRLRAGALSCLCILSHLPWFEVFYKLLNTVGDLLAQDQTIQPESRPSESPTHVLAQISHPHSGLRGGRTSSKSAAAAPSWDPGLSRSGVGQWSEDCQCRRPAVPCPWEEHVAFLLRGSRLQPPAIHS